ncbi:MAG: molybdate ABC transporter permease subunit [Candidatus Eisenbacteria bacterium]|nr:molybdate ABC transporter permease subunit [Candidatus Eisenbacteria bacterium]
MLMLAFYLFPLAGLLVRAPGALDIGRLGGERVLAALRLSFIVSFLATAFSLLFGFPLAWVLARRPFPGKNLVRALVMLPMVLPPVVGGVALLTAFGRRGLLGGVLERFGVGLPFSLAGAVTAAAFVASPFLVLTLEAGIRSTDRRLEEAAASLGASRWTVLRAVILPAIRPSLFAGAALAWARAVGEFGATITFAGNLPGRTQTLPLAVYETLQTDHEGAILLSLLLLAVSLVVLALMRGKGAFR